MPKTLHYSLLFRFSLIGAALSRLTRLVAIVSPPFHDYSPSWLVRSPGRLYSLGGQTGEIREKREEEEKQIEKEKTENEEKRTVPLARVESAPNSAAGALRGAGDITGVLRSACDENGTGSGREAGSTANPVSLDASSRAFVQGGLP